MARIYATLKRQVVTGAFEPGARLDPARLKDDLAASTMPIRDALQRLTGEGLVENSLNEGFRVVQMTDAAVRDLYDWCADLCHLCLRRADRLGDALRPDVRESGIYAEEVTRMLLRIASLSPNHEHRRAMINLCERSYLLRTVEEKLLADPPDLNPIKSALDRREWHVASEQLDRFHATRIAIMPAISASLRDHSKSSRSDIF